MRELITSTYLVVFFCFNLASQESEFLDGKIITRKGDTLKGQIKVQNRFRSFNKIIYLDNEGNEKKVAVDSIKSYERGKEFFETLIINSKLFVLAKRIILGPNMTLYYRNEATEVFPGLLDMDGVLPKVLNNEYRYKYLKDKNNNVITLSFTRRAGETPFKDIVEKLNSKPLHKNKSLKRFLSEYPNIIKKIEAKQITKIEEVVVECNNVSGEYWKN